MGSVLCPSRAELTAFNLGDLPEPRLDEVADHVECCATCEQALQATDASSDEVLAALQQTAAVGPPELAPPAHVGGYELLHELGRGGMGIVYEARHRALGRRVALKMLLGGGRAGPEERLRFRAEAEAAARLQHPGIVQVYDVGESVDAGGVSLLYLALELMPGGSLASRLNGRPLPPRQVAGWLEALARATHAAHAAGIVHRDIKPSNVLLTGDGTPKLGDFGVAKLATGDDGHGSARTRTGAVLGTPSYMAPEQAAAGAAGPAADVYALGAVLYECLTGRPPFRGADALDTLIQVRALDPVPVRTLQPAVPRDLETVCLKCLEKEAAQRYASAAELADDLRRFLDSRPVLARPLGPASRAWRWARRRPTTAGLLTALIVSLLTGTATSAYFAVTAAAARDHALDQERQAVAGKNEARRRLAAADFRQGQALAESGRIADGLQWMFASLSGLSDEAVDGPVRRALQTNLAAWSERLHRLQFLETYSDDVFATALSPDGRQLAVSAGVTGTIHLYDLDTGQPAGAPLEHGQHVRALAFSPDGRTLVSGGAGTPVLPGRVRRWDVAAGTALSDWPVRPGAIVLAIRFRPEGRRFVTAGRDVPVQEWEADTGRPVTAWDTGGRVEEMFAPAGAGPILAVSGDRQKLAAVTCLADGQTRRVELGEGVRATLHPDGTAVWVCRRDGSVRRWDLTAGRFVGTPLEHPAIARAAVTADGQMVVVASSERFRDGPATSLTFHRAADGQFLGRLGQDELCGALSFSPDGRLLAAAAGRAVRVWQLAAPVPLAGGASRAARWDDLPLTEFAGAVYSRDRTRWAAAGVSSGVARLGRIAPDLVLHNFEQPVAGHRDRPGQVALAPDGSLMAGMISRTAVRLWNADTGAPVGEPLRHDTDVSTMAFSPDGRVLATGDYDRQVRLWDAATGRALSQPLVQTDIVYSLAFSPDGRYLAVGVYRDLARQCSASVWNVQTRARVGKPLVTATQPELLFSPDGRTLATSAGVEVVCWDVEQARQRGPVLTHPPGRTAVAFSPDGRVLATGGSDGIVRRWGVDDLRVLPGVLGLSGSGVTRLAFAPDGRHLAVATHDRTVRVWDVAAGRVLGPPVVATARTIGLTFTSDGSGLLATTSDGRTLASAVPGPRGFDPERFGQELRVRTGLDMGDGRVVVPLSAAAWRSARDRLAAEGSTEQMPPPAIANSRWGP